MTGSWQDVKDHFREAGDIIFADVYKDGTGVVEFSRHDHMKRALRDLEDSKFKSHEVCVSVLYLELYSSLFLKGETGYVRVREPDGARSPSPRHNQSYSRSRSRSRSR